MVNYDLWQEIASLKRQFAELLSDIGFIKEGLKARIIEQMSSKGTDGVMEATGPEVTHIQITESVIRGLILEKIIRKF